MKRFRKKLYYLLFSLKSFGISGLFLWLKLEILGLQCFRVPGLSQPINLRTNTSDILAFRQIFFLNEYSSIFAIDPKWIVDAGSNIGLFSVYIKNKYPNSNVVSIEPELSNFNVLKMNLANYSSVYTENKGLWYKDCRLNILEKEELGKWGTQVQESQNGSIEAISIDTIFAKYKIDVIDVLKIDIETSEKYLFNNSNDWLKKVRVIIIEFHDRLENGTSVSFFKALSNNIENFNYYHLGDNTVILNLDLCKNEER